MSYIGSFDYNDKNVYSFIFDPAKSDTPKEVAIKSMVFNGIRNEALIPDITIKIKIFFGFFNYNPFGYIDDNDPVYNWNTYLEDFTFEFAKKTSTLTKFSDYDFFVSQLNKEIEQQFIDKATLSIKKWWSRIYEPQPPLPSPIPSPPAVDVDNFLSNINVFGYYSIGVFQAKSGLKISVNLPAPFAYGNPVLNSSISSNFCYVEIVSENFKFTSNQNNLTDLQFTYINNGFDTQLPQYKNNFPWYQAIYSFTELTPEIRQFVTNSNVLISLIGLVNVQMDFTIDLWFLYKTQSKIIISSDINIKNSMLVLGNTTIEMNVLDSICYENLDEDVLIYKPEPQNWKISRNWGSQINLSIFDFKTQNGRTLKPLVFSSVQIEILYRPAAVKELSQRVVKKKPVKTTQAVKYLKKILELTELDDETDFD
jgi:hypothetical protein